MITLQLLKRACRVFPRTVYLEDRAVRHARREWARSVEILRSAPGGSKWILDRPAQRVQ